MKRLPVLAVVLGVLGLLPFLGCTLGIIAYGAVILAFLGGVHWGFALEPRPTIVTPGHADTDRMRLLLGVLPSLVGWAALLVVLVASPMVAVVLLLLGFGGTTLAEAQAQRRGAMPAGYMALRWSLSAIVVLCLLAVLLARTF